MPTILEPFFLAVNLGIDPLLEAGVDGRICRTLFGKTAEAVRLMVRQVLLLGTPKKFPEWPALSGHGEYEERDGLGRVRAQASKVVSGCNPDYPDLVPAT